MNIEQFHQMDEAQKIKNFHKIIKADKYTSFYDLNGKTLAYAKHTHNPMKIYLTKKQKNHAGFLLALYRLQPELTNARYPGERLFNNVDFMFEYYKIRYNAKLMWDNIYMMTHFNPEILTNPVFIEKIANEFPKENILKVMRYAQVYSHKYTFTSVKPEDYDNTIKRLPIEVLVKQAYKFGSEFVECLPKSHPKFKYLVHCASVKDKSALKYLPKLDNHKTNNEKTK